MHKRTLIKNATLVNEGRSFTGSLVIEDEHIEEIAEGKDVEPALPSDETIDAEGCYLLPGVIDTHVHFRSPGLTHKADMKTESRAAAAGGVTTFFDMPNTQPQTTTLDAYNDKVSCAERESAINYSFFFGATNDNADLLRHLDSHKVCGIKLFMGASTGNMLVNHEKALRAIFETARLPVMAHCEDPEVIAANQKACTDKYGPDPAVGHHPEIRSEEACCKSTRLAVHLAKEYGTRLHVAHVSTAKELRFFSPETPNITAEACVAYLLFSDEDYARYGTRIKCNPAIKTAADRDALRHALRTGRISTIGTDHAPHLLREKLGGCLKAASGIPSIQFSLPAMLDLVDGGILTIENLVKLMCHNPARIFDLENRGYLREGYKADLVLVRPRTLWTLTPNLILSKCNWSPFEGHTFHWRVEKTFCNGFLIYNQGHITDENFRGEAVTFCR